MSKTSLLDKYPNSLGTVTKLFIGTFFVKTAIEILVSLFSGLTLGIYAAAVNLDRDVFLQDNFLYLNMFALIVADAILIKYLINKTKDKRFHPIKLKDALKPKTDYSFAVFLVLGVFAFSLIGGLLSQYVSGLMNASLPEQISQLMDAGSILSFRFVLSILAAVIVAPLFEELFFRKILMDGLLSKESPIKVILFTSLLFAVFHLNIPQGINAFFLGIYLGGLYYLTGDFRLAYVTHAVYNLYATLVHTLAPDTSGILAIVLVSAGALSLIKVFIEFRANKVTWLPLVEPEIDENQDGEDGQEGQENIESKEALHLQDL